MPPKCMTLHEIKHMKPSGIWKQMWQEQSRNNFLLFWFTQFTMISFVRFGMICSFRRGFRRFILRFPLTNHKFYVHKVHGPNVICKGYDLKNVCGGTFESDGVCVILSVILNTSISVVYITTNKLLIVKCCVLIWLVYQHFWAHSLCIIIILLYIDDWGCRYLLNDMASFLISILKFLLTCCPQE